eukprot:Blabericola_migrator_1__12526@NODE_794_length_6482_cov_180_629930_g562_i0_p1_GENE_NODE_794_length_6482_cov_180_629930_g562_i0NODE_794_length_6482_cov_180_629930_g562_i0_p1_ORF_typecomplete_len601_score46_89_NODE_794_length_6482_cov_180_629930_g562_i0841805
MRGVRASTVNFKPWIITTVTECLVGGPPSGSLEGVIPSNTKDTQSIVSSCTLLKRQSQDRPASEGSGKKMKSASSSDVCSGQDGKQEATSSLPGPSSETPIDMRYHEIAPLSPLSDPSNEPTNIAGDAALSNNAELTPRAIQRLLGIAAPSTSTQGVAPYFRPWVASSPAGLSLEIAAAFTHPDAHGNTKRAPSHTTPASTDQIDIPPKDAQRSMRWKSVSWQEMGFKLFPQQNGPVLKAPKSTMSTSAPSPRNTMINHRVVRLGPALKRPNELLGGAPGISTPARTNNECAPLPWFTKGAREGHPSSSAGVKPSHVKNGMGEGNPAEADTVLTSPAKDIESLFDIRGTPLPVHHWLLNPCPRRCDTESQVLPIYEASREGEFAEFFSPQAVKRRPPSTLLSVDPRLVHFIIYREKFNQRMRHPFSWRATLLPIIRGIKNISSHPSLPGLNRFMCEFLLLTMDQWQSVSCLAKSQECRGRSSWQKAQGAVQQFCKDWNLTADHMKVLSAPQHIFTLPPQIKRLHPIFLSSLSALRRVQGPTGWVQVAQCIGNGFALYESRFGAISEPRSWALH